MNPKNFDYEAFLKDRVRAGLVVPVSTRAIVTFSCPKCKAGKNQGCETPSGRRANVHRERLALWFWPETVDEERYNSLISLCLQDGTNPGPA